MFRVFLDAYFVLANVCSNPGFLSTYFKSDETEVEAYACYFQDVSLR